MPGGPDACAEGDEGATPDPGDPGHADGAAVPDWRALLAIAVVVMGVALALGVGWGGR